MSKIEIPVRIRNEYDIRLIDAKTGEVKQHVKAHNVVTDLLYDHIFGNTQKIGYVKLGTGSGVPATSDTSLFTWLATKQVAYNEVYQGLPDNVNAATYSCVFSENEANGSLTEVGLSPNGSNNGTVIWTHSRFTDSEDEPIVIVKTEFDKLSITATIYSTILPSNGPFNPVRFVSFSRLVTDLNAAQPPFTTGLQYSGFVRATLGEAGVRTNFKARYAVVRGATAPYAGSDVWAVTPGAVSISSVTDGYTRISIPRVLADSQNGQSTLQIKSIAVYGGTGNYVGNYDSGGVPMAASLEFPNHTVFPPKTLELTAAGDGSNSDFNFGIPVLMSNPEVYVDGQLQDPNTYDWGGRDFSCAQAWLNCDTDCLDQSLTNMSYNTYEYSDYAVHPTCLALRSPKNSSYHASYVQGRLQNSIGWDFKTPVRVSEIRDNTGSNIFYNLFLEYSNDKENWQQAVQLPNSSSATFNLSFTPVTARYWRILGSGQYHPRASSDGNQRNNVGSYIWLGLGDPKPQLSFHSAPASGSVIRVLARTEYPIKNPNWLIDNTIIDFKITRQS